MARVTTLSNHLSLGVCLAVCLLPLFFPSVFDSVHVSCQPSGSLIAVGPRPPPPSYAARPRRGAIDTTLYHAHDEKCLLEAIKSHAMSEFQKDKTMAATLLRLSFHDCLTKGGGCDGSVFKTSEINDTLGINGGVQAAVPVITRIRLASSKQCNAIPTLADTIARAGSAALSFSFLPDATEYGFRLGRRDISPRRSGDDPRNLPAVREPFTTVLGKLTTFGLTVEEVTLFTIGGHSIGKSICGNFAFRLNQSVDKTGRSMCAHPVDASLDPGRACELTKVCAKGGFFAEAPFDDKTTFSMDNAYFKILLDRRALLDTDQEFASDSRTAAFVRKYASASQLVFQRDFLKVFVKVELVGINGPTTEAPSQYYYDTSIRAAT